MSNNIPTIVQPFLDTLKFEKRYSPHTIRSYQDDLTQFFDYLVIQFGEIEMEHISSSLIRSWLVSLKDGKLTAKSISRKLSALKSFFKYQMRIGVLDFTPLLISSPLKSVNGYPIMLSRKKWQFY